MKLNLQNISLTIAGYVSKCHCRCNHCLLSSGMRGLPEVSYGKLKGLAEKFIGFRDKYNFHVMMAVYNSCEFKELADSINVNKKLNYTHAGYLNLNGTAIRSGEKLSEWVKHLKAEGMTNANISWFGLQGTHDSFVNRQGYYDYLIELSKVLHAEEIQFSNSIFMTRFNIEELEKLVSQLEVFGGDNGYWLSDYRGYAKNNVNEILKESDISILPKEIIKSEAIANYYPEYEWTKRVKWGKYPELKKKSLLLVARPDNLHEYMQMHVEDILKMFDKIDSQLQETIPSFEYLAQNYGDEQSNLLYSFRSIIWKWIDDHFKANPHLDKGLLFSDAKSSVMWK